MGVIKPHLYSPDYQAMGDCRVCGHGQRVSWHNGENIMRKDEAIALIDMAKQNLINPVDMLHWTWLRVIILQIPDEDWDKYVGKATEVLSQ
jgi:hypothetical protein